MTKTPAGMRTLKPKAVDFAFPVGGVALYALSAKADRMDIINQLTMQLTHLTTMLTVITGEASESFNQHGAEMRDVYIHSCRTIADECRELSGLL